MRDRIDEYIRSWKARGYEEDIPDAVDSRLESLLKVPSYRMLCRAIFKNDLNLLSLGCSRPKCKTYNDIKKIELIGKGKKHIQLSLF